MTNIRPEDLALWEAAMKDATPLGTPKKPERPFTHMVVQKVTVDFQLDLHGLSVQEAHKATTAFLADAVATHKAVTIITGLSGEIKREFPFWLERNPAIRSFEELNGGGAYQVRFKRSQQDVNSQWHNRRKD